MSEPSSPTGIERPVEVVASDEQTEVPLDADRWAAFARSVLVAEGCHGELTLTFVDGAEIAALNLEHMGKSGPTDVLSFPLDAFDDEPSVGPMLLGDVVICPEVAALAAPTHAGSLDDELALLIVHGILHILGHDHAEPGETKRMRDRELELLADLFWEGAVRPPNFVHEQDDPA